MHKHKFFPALLGALVLIPVSASAHTVTLNFSTFTESVFLNNINTSYYDNPIESSYSISLDSNTLQNFATTTAYNHNPNYIETVSTNINNNGEYASTDYFIANGDIKQTYNQSQTGGTINRSMGVSVDFRDQFSKQLEVGAIYTGNLPTTLIPTNSGGMSTSGNTRFSWNKPLGSNPNFVLLDETKLSKLFSLLLGQRFNFSQSNYTSVCTSANEFGVCYNSINVSNEFRNGYATLSSVNLIPSIVSASAVSQVPVPAAIWFFASGLGMLGFGLRKKSPIVTV